MKQTIFTVLTLSLLAIACQGVSVHTKDVLPSLTFSSVEGRVGDPLTVTPDNQVANSVIRTCSISPALPQGLTLNQKTCAVSGTPTAGISETDFTVTATNSIGSVTPVNNTARHADKNIGLYCARLSLSTQ